MRLDWMRWILALSVFGLAFSLPTGAVAGGELDGKWRSGRWTDDNTGHEGPLKGRFRERSDGNYRVVFTGRFAGIVPFRFATTLNVVGHEEGKIVLAGESRVPGFGRFTYEGIADEHAFQASYSSRRWRGQFLLSR